MAVIKAFKAIRPVEELAHKVAALPYDVMDGNEAREMVMGNPYSFLHVDRAETDLDPAIDPYDRRVYEKASENLRGMIRKGILVQDKKNCLYIYRLTMNDIVQVGLVGCASVDDYEKNVIKRHELTRADKEQDRINHVDYCNANTGLVFLTYRARKSIDETLKDWMASRKPVYDFVSDDGISHAVWVIDKDETIKKLESDIKAVDYLYIADGHHRSASAVKVGQKRRRQFPDYTGDEEFNFFLSTLFPDDQLYIMEYNRVVKDLNGNSKEEFLEKASRKFLIEEYECGGPFKPAERHCFGMYLDGTWYKLKAKPGTYRENDPVGRLDVSIIQDNLLDPILGIKDPRTDGRICFVGGIRGLKELEKMVDDGMKVAFSMFPATIEDMMQIADKGTVMPPKSTWFEPKLRSGLFIHEL